MFARFKGKYCANSSFRIAIPFFFGIYSFLSYTFSLLNYFYSPAKIKLKKHCYNKCIYLIYD